MGPEAAQITITNPAPTNAQVDPSHAEAAEANRPKWSCTVGALSSAACFFMDLFLLVLDAGLMVRPFAAYRCRVQNTGRSKERRHRPLR